jgi:competence protein ComEC
VGRLGLAFLAGHCCIHLLSSLPDAAYIAALAAGLLVAAALRSRVLFALLAGIAWAWGHAAYRLAHELTDEEAGQDILVEGYIGSLPAGEGDVRFVLDDVHAAEASIPSRLLLTWYDAPQRLAPGERWRLVVRLKRRSGFANPGGFNYETHLFREGIGATGYVRGDDRNLLLAAPGWRYRVTQTRDWIATRMAEALRTMDGLRVAGGQGRSEGAMLGVLQGLAIGDTRAMTAPQWEVFAATGTTHLMAISGLHITMLVGLAAACGGLIVRWRGAQARGWTSMHGRAIAGALAAVCYALLAGFSIPTQRTLIMLCIYFGARWRRRELPIAHALGLAIVGVLLIDPFAPLAPGAWLSFGAVAIILLATSGQLRGEGAIAGFTRVQGAISIGMAPLLLVAFGSFSLVSPVANAIAVPVFTIVVVPLVLLGAAGAAVSPVLGGPPLWLADQVLALLWRLLEWLATQPLALWYFPELSLPALAALALGALLLVLPGVWMSRALGALLCAQAFIVQAPRPQHGEVELAVLDVGQGLANVVRTRNHVLVFDAGPAFRSGRDAAEFAVLPYLRAQGVRRLDELIVSHGDLDHRGGAPALLRELPATSVRVGPSVAMRSTEPCLRGQQWAWDGVRFEILHPDANYAGSNNDSSCVLRVTARDWSFLLTGDIEASGEFHLLPYLAGGVDVVVAAHHGSRTSSRPEFVAAAGASLVIFSAGYRNRWGLPKEDIVTRWRDSGARALTTADSGAIEVTRRAGGALEVREYRRTHRRYWMR